MAVVIAISLAGGAACDDSPAERARSAETTTSDSSSPTTTATTTPAPPSTVPSTGAPGIGGACTVPAAYPDPWVDRPRYTGRLVVPAGNAPVTGEVDVRFTPDADTDRLVFRLWPNAPRLSHSGGRLEVTAAFVDGHLTAGTYEAAGAAAARPGTLFALPGAFSGGRAVGARIEFRLVMPGPVNDRVSRIGSTFRLGSVFPLLSWVRGDGWHTDPAVDGFTEAVASEVADWDVRIEVPPGSVALATGEEVEPGRFVASAVRDWSATVAPMRVAEVTAQGGRTTVVVGVAGNAGGDPGALAHRVAAILDGMAARFGNYPYPRLSVAVTPSLTGGIEFPTHIHFGSAARRASLVHEVAHQWFYGVAGNDQYRDPWLDEALATYAEARFNGRLAAQRARAIPAVGRGNIGQSLAFWRNHPGAHHQSVYLGGLQALGVLADRLGGYEALDCALRRYHRDRAYTVSRPSDFFDAVVRQTGVDPRPVLDPFGIR